MGTEKAERKGDAELLVIQQVTRKLLALDEDARIRVLSYLMDRHGPKPVAICKPLAPFPGA